jgi:hypothetical protein
MSAQQNGHTPGPWHWRNDRLIRYEKSGPFIDLGIGASAGSDGQVSWSDRSLIASAPDLLAASEILVAQIDNEVDGAVDAMLAFDNAVVAIRAAIAKAKGRS